MSEGEGEKKFGRECDRKVHTQFAAMSSTVFNSGQSNKEMFYSDKDFMTYST